MKSHAFVLALLVLVAPAAALAAPAGRVDFAVGRVEATGPDGRARLLVRGAEVASGDSISTNDGRAQIRFTDGAFVSLAPNTEFGIREYAWDGRADGSEKGFFSLLKGAMRTVTGLVGRTNRQAYELKTPTATIGIRGTGGLIVVNADTSTRITGTSGIWVLSNGAGSIDVPAGASGFVGPDANRPPLRVAQPAVMPPVAFGGLPRLPNFSEGEQRTERGLPASIDLPQTIAINQPPQPPAAPTVPPVTGGGGTGGSGGGGGTGGGGSASGGGGTGGGGSTGGGGGGNTGGGGGGAGTAAFGGVAYVYQNASMNTSAIGNDGTNAKGTPLSQFDTAATKYVQTGRGQTVDAGSDANLSWGRWIGPVNFTDPTLKQMSFGANGGLHYLNGVPTTASDMQLQKGQMSYAFSGATSPTLGNEIASGRFVNGMLSVDFDKGRVGIAFGTDFGSLGMWQVATTGGATPGGAGTSEVRIDGSTFAGKVPTTYSSPAVASATSLATGTQGGCSPTCTASISGGFAGPMAAGAGFAYQIGNVLVPGASAATTINGVAAFRR